MRKVSTLVGLTVLVLSGAARAQEEAPAAAPAADSAAAPAPADAAGPAPEVVKPAAAASESKMSAGINLLPMLLGKAKGDGASADLKMAYGVGLVFNYAVIPGLTVGVAPQFLFNVKPKDGGGDSAKAYDLLARVAYTYTVIPKLGIFGEVLPGYSIVSMPDPINKSAKGFVVAAGAGATYDVTDQMFVSLAVGYQYGLQKVDSAKDNFTYLRIALGAGARF